MSQRACTFAPGEYYHIYNRGNSKQTIFKSKMDYARFIALLYGTNTSDHFNFYNDEKLRDVFAYMQIDPPVAIGAYCLMPNHFHILVTPLRENGVPEFMKKLSTAYVMYFNLKYKRTGGLFEGRYKAEHLSNDKYLKYVFSYIHLNPVKLFQKDWHEVGIHDQKSTLKFLSTYSFSSYIDFTEHTRKESKILSLKNFPLYFPTKERFFKEIQTWLNYGKDIARTDLTI